jgi:signal transduction histidine kinase
VQKSLTNVIRHPGASQAWVHVARAASRLVVELRDDGRSPTRTEIAPGYGWRGMAERVEAVGGTLNYEIAPGGGWCVRAVLPTRATGS